MKFKSQAIKIHDFLKRYENIWRFEIMDYYPDSLNVVEEDWIDSLIDLDIQEWHKFESSIPVDTLKNSKLQNFLDEINQLTQLEAFTPDANYNLEDWAYKDVKEKKRHEIDVIAPYIKELDKEINIKKLVDIGGGVGHLSRICAYYYQIECISIDKEINFQEIGKKRLTRYRKPLNAKDVHFVNLEYSKNKIDNIKDIVGNESFTLGLHTCGELAVEVIDTTLQLKNKGLLSFGCCYHKLHNKNRFKISNFYQDNNFLDLSLFAFTLASRAHGATQFSEFETKYFVKNFRQALHLFFIEKFNRNDILDVGEVHIREYHGCFSDYVLSRLKHLKIEHSYSALEIEDFYKNKELQLTLKKLFIINLIRWKIGRVLEIYVLLDRALYCEEQGLKVSLNTFFDETKSPRNIGITAINY